MCIAPAQVPRSVISIYHSRKSRSSDTGEDMFFSALLGILWESGGKWKEERWICFNSRRKKIHNSTWSTCNATCGSYVTRYRRGSTHVTEQSRGPVITTQWYEIQQENADNRLKCGNNNKKGYLLKNGWRREFWIINRYQIQFAERYGDEIWKLCEANVWNLLWKIKNSS